MRVLHLISAKPSDPERQVMDLLPSLSGLGIDARAITVFDTTAQDVKCSAGTAIESLHRRGRDDYTFVPKLYRTIRRLNPDVVHTHTRVGKYWGRPAARLAGVRAIVHTEHEPCDPFRTPTERILSRAYARFTDRFVLFFPDQVDVFRRLEAIGPEKIVAIPSGLEDRRTEGGQRREQARRAQAIPSDRLAVMTIGRLEPNKNHVLALHAVAGLSPAMRERVALYVVGSGSQEAALRDLSCRLGIGASTRFLGHRSDAGDLLAAADILLNTSRFEGMPTTFVEAMLAGVSIVTTPWTGAGNMLDYGSLGFISSGWSARHVSETLERALDDGEGRARRIATALARARRDYSLERSSQSHAQLYEDVLYGRAG